MCAAFQKANATTLLLLVVFSLTAASCGSGGSSGSPAPPGGDQPVVYIANQDMVMQFELYASFDNGVERIKLSAPLVSGGNVVEFEISPDGRWVAYKADQEENEKFELYVVPITGGIPVNVSRRFGTLLEVEDFDWAPNSFWVAFRAYNANSGPTGGNIELFTNRPDGNSSAKVSKAPVQGQEVRAFAWAPDSQQIAYTANVIQGQSNKFDLYTTSPVSQDNINLTKFSPTFADAKDIAWAPNSELVAFLADISAPNAYELLVADPASVLGGYLSISGSLVTGREVLQFAWSPDHSRIAFISDKLNNDVYELYTVFPDGLVEMRINDNSIVGSVYDFRWAPDSTRIAYIADEDTLGVVELYASNDNGAVKSKLSNTPPMAGGVVIDKVSGKGFFEWAPDSSRVAYIADQESVGKFELYSATRLGGDNDKVSGTPMAGSVDSFSWSPDGDRLAYLADQVALNLKELFSSTPDGGVNDVVSGPMTPGGNVEAPDPLFSGAAFIWAPDGGRIAYRADQETNNVFELFTSAPDGSENTKISDDLFIGEAVQTFAWGL